MAITCPVDFDTQVLRLEVSSVYSRVATDPAGDFHFHRGPAYAANFLCYDAGESSCWSASAHNSMNMVKFHCSTAIRIAGTELPAGDSTSQMLDAGDGSCDMLVRSVSSL